MTGDALVDQSLGREFDPQHLCEKTGMTGTLANPALGGVWGQRWVDPGS